ncbi:MAG: DALR anticodon-binding domain-containing protein [Polyangiales bacterium]
MVSFSGDAGPYVQYAYARCRSIFRKGDVDPDSVRVEDAIAVDHPTEKMLVRQLLRFDDVVHRASETSQPHLICEHAYDLARAFSSFYTECPVLDADGATRNHRLALTDLVARQIRRSLGLVGIEVVEKM